MFRVLLTVAMLLQVATCSFSCALESAPRGESPQAVRKCKCCPAQQPSRESAPSDQREDDDDCGVCFCNSAANPTPHCDLDLILDSHAIWTVVQPCPPVGAALDCNRPTAPWLSADGSGAGARLAVQSLLL